MMSARRTALSFAVVALAIGCATTGGSAGGDPLADCQRRAPGTDTWLCDGWTAEFHQASDLDGEATVVLDRAQKRASLSGLTGDALAREDLGAGGTRLRSREAPLVDVYRVDGQRDPLLLTCTYSVVQPTQRCRNVASLLADHAGRVGFWLKPVVVE
jgi:hypothetical protein